MTIARAEPDWFSERFNTHGFTTNDTENARGEHRVQFLRALCGSRIFNAHGFTTKDTRQCTRRTQNTISQCTL